jgi:hypothetical protein
MCLAAGGAREGFCGQPATHSTVLSHKPSASYWEGVFVYSLGQTEEYTPYCGLGFKKKFVNYSVKKCN